MKKTLLTIFSLAAISLAGVNGQTIVGFNLAGTTTDPWAASTVADNLTMTSGLNRVGLGASSSASAFGSNGWNITDTFNESDDYLTFSFTPNVGYQVSITELSWTRLNGSSTGPGTGRWGYRIGNSGSFTLQDTFLISGTTTNAAGAWSSIGIVDATDTVEFRFWAFGATSIGGGTSANAGGVTYRSTNASNDDLVVNGSVTAVPEPSTVAFLGFSALGLCFYLWRRRRA
jgi:hypothetical protein